jgi:hypothetical protein
MLRLQKETDDPGSGIDNHQPVDLIGKRADHEFIVLLLLAPPLVEAEDDSSQEEEQQQLGNSELDSKQDAVGDDE